MYAIKPWGKAAMVGCTVGSLVAGIGMRWRETVVEIVDKAKDPAALELHNYRRCVLSENAVRMMGDLGVNTQILSRQLRTAKNWKIVNHDMQTIREGNGYPGCSPSEAVYVVPEGQLIRALRREYMKYGGHMHWDCTAYEPYRSVEQSDLWCVAKDYGPIVDTEAVLCFARGNDYFQHLLLNKGEGADAELGVAFDVSRGVCRRPFPDLQMLFGHDVDYVVALGKRLALHVWTPEPATYAWKMVSYAKPPGERNSDEDVARAAGKKDSSGDSESGAESTSVKRVDLSGEDARKLLHPTFRMMMGSSEAVFHDTVVIPAMSPTINDDMQQERISVRGDALLPIDPFEWRGDRALIDVESSTDLVDAIYRKKFHRGHIPSIFRDAEMNDLMRRSDLLRRDMIDAENFLADKPLLAGEDEDEEPTLKRIS